MKNTRQIELERWEMLTQAEQDAERKAWETMKAELAQPETRPPPKPGKLPKAA